MRTILSLTVLLAACSKAPPESVPEVITEPTPAPAPATIDDDDDDEDGRESKQIWGGVSGFKSFVVESLDENGAGYLGSFAVLMPDASGLGHNKAIAYGWDPPGDWAGLEAWEWSGAAWPAEGFQIVDRAGARGSGTVNVFEHAAFTATSAPLQLGESPEVQSYRLERESGSMVGWFVVELEGGALKRVHWLAEPDLSGDLITVGTDKALRFVPAALPPGVVGLPIVQAPAQAP